MYNGNKGRYKWTLREWERVTLKDSLLQCASFTHNCFVFLYWIFGKFITQNIYSISIDNKEFKKKWIKWLYIALLNYIHFLLLGDLKPGGARSRKPTKDSEVFLKSLLTKLNKSICISSLKYWSTMQKNPLFCHIRTKHNCASYIHIPSLLLPAVILPNMLLTALLRTTLSNDFFPHAFLPHAFLLPTLLLPTLLLTALLPLPATPTVMLSLSSWFQRKSICLDMIHF